MERKKIVLIGPVYPYKGGISHYTSLMYKALSQKHDVTMISYKMQYPRFLFKAPQKDYRNDMFKIESAQFLVNTANPFNLASVGLKIKHMHPDIIIIQWWHPYFAPCYWLLGKVIGKQVKKMFICHNVFPHERFPLDRFLTKIVLREADAYIVHSTDEGKDLLSIKPDAKFKRNPHPTYNVFKIKNITRNQARKDLQISSNEKMLLFFGFVREYKGLKYLLRAMPMVKEALGNISLWIVGAFGSDKEEYMSLIEKNNISDCIKIVDGYTPDDEVEKYFTACDAVMLPYESATQSGIAQIAYGFEKPVIATNVGGLADVVIDGKTGYMVEAKDEKRMAEAIIRFYQEDREAEFCEGVKAESSKYSWGKMVETIESLL